MAFESRFTSTDDAPTRRETTCGLSCHFIESLVPRLRVGRGPGQVKVPAGPLASGGALVCLDRYIFGAARVPGLRSRPVTTLVSMRYVVVREGFPWVQTLAWTALAAGIAGAAGRASQRLLWND